MVKGFYLVILMFLILITSSLVNATTPYSSDFDLRNMMGFDDGTISAEDIMAFIQEKYPDSPMLNEEDVGNCFISTGKNNGVNPAFLVATACLEGGFGTLGWAKSHPECHNPFGYGISSGTTSPDDVNCMDSWCGMIQRVASVIAHGHNYYAQGLYTISQVREKYAVNSNEVSIASLMNELYAFSVDRGATYPSAAAEAASIGIIPKAVFLSDLGAYRSTFSEKIRYNSEASMKIANVKYDRGIQFEDWRCGKFYAYFNLNGEYSHLTGLIGLDDRTSSPCPFGRRGNATVVFRGDDRDLQTFELVPGEFPRNIDIDVSGVRRLSVEEVSQDCGGRIIDLIDMALTKLDAGGIIADEQVANENQEDNVGKSRFVDIREYKDKIGPGGELSGVPPSMGGSIGA